MAALIVLLAGISVFDTKSPDWLQNKGGGDNIS